MAAGRRLTARRGDGSGIAQALDGASQAIEGKFVSAGQTLERAVDLVGELIASLDRLAAALDLGAVEGTTGDLAAAAGRLNAMSAAQVDRRDHFQDLAGIGGRLGERLGDMRRSLSYLRVFAINIKITAGGIPTAGKEFDVFAEEIYAAIDQGRRQLDEFAAELDGLVLQLDRVLAQEIDLDRRCSEMLPAVPNRLGENGRAIVEHHRRMAAAAAEVGTLARSVQGKVAATLSALQIGDSTRQRIEHVQAALAMLEDAAVPAAVRAGMAGVVHGLLAAQLDDAEAAFSREVDRIALNLTGLAADAGEILRLRDMADGDGFLRRLEDSVGEAMALSGEIEAGHEAALAIGRSAESTARNLGERVAGVRAIKAGIQQMTLNTSLKCGRLGDPGKPLGVIAVELRLYAGRLEETAGETEAGLRELAGGPDTGDEAAASQGAQSIDQILQGAVARIREAGDKVGSDLLTLAHQADGVTAALGQATVRLNLQAEVGDVLRRSAQALQADAAAPGAMVEAEIAGPLQDLLERIHRLYTMAREREVHRTAVPSAQPGRLAA